MIFFICISFKLGKALRIFDCINFFDRNNGPKILPNIPPKNEDIFNPKNLKIKKKIQLL